VGTVHTHGGVIKVGVCIIDSEGTPEGEGKRRSRIGTKNSLRKVYSEIQIATVVMFETLCQQIVHALHHSAFLYARPTSVLQVVYPFWFIAHRTLHDRSCRRIPYHTISTSTLAITSRSHYALEYSPLVVPWVGRKLHLRRQSEPRFCVIELHVRSSTAVIRAPEAVQACHKGGSVQSGSGALRAALPTAMNQV
jgi:hypothetical protein